MRIPPIWAIPTQGQLVSTEGVQIDREIHVAASVAQVKAYSKQCPCPSALMLTPEGAGTRARVMAEVVPDDLANHVEGLLVDLLRSMRAHFDSAERTADPNQSSFEQVNFKENN